MPSVIHGGDESIDLLEAPSATENGGTQAPYCIPQHKAIVGEERRGRRLGVWGFASRKVVQS